MKHTLLLLTLIAATCSFRLWEREINIPSLQSINYPVRATYIDKLLSWSGMNVAANLGLPGYANPHDYNYIIFAFYSCKRDALDVAKAWQNISTYVGKSNPWGTTDKEVQLGMKKIYNSAGIKVMVSAFGSTEFPTTHYQDPVMCAKKLGNFVLDNNLDGADIDWQDNSAMEKGLGEDWLIRFTRALREVIPNKIITHCPQAPYFKNTYYPKGGYITINQQIGSLIDFYLVQFYNQGDSQYNTYSQLFLNASGKAFNGTALTQIADLGIPLNKLVVVKPIVKTDASNTGWVDSNDLGQWALQAYNTFGWYGGIGHWQYSSDQTGKTIKNAAGPLINVCRQSGKCK